MTIFQDRAEAGFLLAEQLTQKNVSSQCVVVGVTRGGIVVASIVASILGLSLIPIPVKKISLEEHEELAIGAIAPGDIVYWDQKVVEDFDLEKSELAALLKKTEPLFKERSSLLRKYVQLSIVSGRSVILIDDGVATGATVKAAALSLKKYGAKDIILAVPVISETVYNELLPAFKDIVTLTIAEDLNAVGDFYESFDQVSDDEVLRILKEK